MAQNESAGEYWRRPTVDELREWLIARPRAGKLLWRKAAHMNMQRRRGKAEIKAARRQQREAYGDVVYRVPTRELTSKTGTYRAGTSAVFQDEFDRTSIVIPGFTRVLASHAMWAMVHGAFPKRLIHKDGDKRNIAARNLALDNQATRDSRTVSKSGAEASYRAVRKALRGTPMGACVSGQPEAVLEGARQQIEKELTPSRPANVRPPSRLQAFTEAWDEAARQAVDEAVEHGAWETARQVDMLGKALRRKGRMAQFRHQVTRAKSL
jgi:hypothetical protein